MTKTFGPYSLVKLAGNFAFVSGQVGVDSSTGKAATGIEAQTYQVLKNLSNVLNEANLTLANVVKTTIYLADMHNFEAVNKVYAEHFTANPPARACVEVSALPNVGNGTPLLIEIDAIAYKEAA